MAVYFMNSGSMDLDVVRTMGVNVKVNDNPIGTFGTGLKYAISVLLRTGHTIQMTTGGELYEFTLKKKEIRGKEFEMIMMGDEQLAFTTEYGKNWEVWQAYRELYSNTMDEEGTVSKHANFADTVIRVVGSEMEKCHEERGQIFLLNEPWLIGDGVEVYRGTSRYMYYRGVRVQELQFPSRYTYNITSEMKLTEDRTLTSQYDMAYKLSTKLPRVADPEFCDKLVDPEWEGFESNLLLSDCWKPSEEFLDALEKHKDDARMKPTLKGMLHRHRKIEQYTPFILNATQLVDVQNALDTLRVRLNAILRLDELIFVEVLGPNIMACVENNKIYISRQCLSNGVDYIAITLYEEWIHDRTGHSDESRGMQQFLFDKILELIKR